MRLTPHCAGLNFRIMLVGESGLGKTTFTRALLRPYVPDHVLDEHQGSAGEPVRARTTSINEMSFKVDNDGFPVEITVVDCPGYGDAVDSTAWIDKIVDYMRKGFEQHFEALGGMSPIAGAGGGLQRDGLVHVCLYFIAAHRLKGVDLEFMRRLEPHVNLVPIIAKADTMTLAERDAFRRQVLGELKQCGVRIFQMNEGGGAGVVNGVAVGAEGGAAETSKNGSSDTYAYPSASAPSSGAMVPAGAHNSVLGSPPAQKAPQIAGQMSMMGLGPTSTTQPPPFAVCSSEDGTRVYPWGTCCVEDPAHSDLSLLRSMLFATSMVAAKRRTLELYESSYAQGRREAERQRSAREARALRRELLVGRALIFSVASSSVGLAAAGVLQVLRPELAARLVASARGAIDQPWEAFAGVTRSAGALLGAVYRRALSLKLPAARSSA